MTIIECINCKKETELAEAMFHKSKGYCKFCYCEKYEKPKLRKIIFNRIKENEIGK